MKVLSLSSGLYKWYAQVAYLIFIYLSVLFCICLSKITNSVQVLSKFLVECWILPSVNECYLFCMQT